MKTRISSVLATAIVSGFLASTAVAAEPAPALAPATDESAFDKAAAELQKLHACVTSVEQQVGPKTPFSEGAYTRGIWAEYSCTSTITCFSDKGVSFAGISKVALCNECVAQACSPMPEKPSEAVALSMWLLGNPSVAAKLKAFEAECKFTAGNACAQFK